MAEDLNTYPPEDQRPVEGVETLGGILATARERHGLAVEQMAAELRVESRLLEALEEDRFEALPAPVFVKGYLRHLSSRFGLEYDDLLHRYTGQTDTQDAPVTYSEPIPEESRFLAPLLIGALVLILGIPALWFTWVGRDLFSDVEAPVSPPGQMESVPEEIATLPDPGVAAEPAAQPSSIELDPMEPSTGESPPGDVPAPDNTSATETVPEDAPAVVESGPAEPPIEEFPTGDVSAPVEQPTETGAANAAPSGEQPPDGAVPGIEPQPQEIAAELGGAALTDAVATEQADGPLVRVALNFEEECWTEVSDGNGNSLYYALAGAGTTVNLVGVPPLSFLLGNPGGVQLSINDQPRPIPPPGPGTTTANFVVDEAP